MKKSFTLRSKSWLVIVALAISACFAVTCAAQTMPYFIPPKVTDSQIDTNLESHYVALSKSAPPKNQLFPFFPGTGGTPFFYQRLANTAADLGYHVISLNYPNDQAVNREWR